MGGGGRPGGDEHGAVAADDHDEVDALNQRRNWWPACRRRGAAEDSERWISWRRSTRKPTTARSVSATLPPRPWPAGRSAGTGEGLVHAALAGILADAVGRPSGAAKLARVPRAPTTGRSLTPPPAATNNSSD